MKARIRNLFLLSALIAALGVLLTGRVAAQTFKTLYNFTALVDDSATSDETNSDGSIPQAGLVLSGNTLYGTAQFGGPYGSGTVFAVNIIDMSLTNLYSFPVYDASIEITNRDSAYPNGGLVLSGNTLYGTSYVGATLDGSGAVFAVNTDGTSFTNLTIFAPGDSQAGLIISGNKLYGTAGAGGAYEEGSVFDIDTNGMSFMYLYSFLVPHGYETNSDGDDPTGPLILSGNTLYGTAQLGGMYDNGTVFAVNIIDMNLTNLHTFTAEAVNNLGQYTNSDGSTPTAGLVLSGNTLYGTAPYGGTNGYGTVFSLNTDGTGFTNLHNFSPLVPNDLVEDVTNSDGANPVGGLTLSGITLYGGTQYGGANGNGTVFSLTFPPQLSIIRSGTNMIVSWPTNVAGFSYIGFTLQSATNLSPAVWSTVSPGPVVVNRQNTVTNGISGTQHFFRLANP